MTKNLYNYRHYIYIYILQVSYNVTVRYQRMTGQRVFNYSHTSDQFSSDFGYSTYEIPLYNANSTYVIRITAETEDKKVITSNDVTISEDELNDYIYGGQHGK